MANISTLLSLNKLRIIIFWQILKENNPLLLDDNFAPDKTYTKDEMVEISDTWKRLYDEYFTMKDDSKSRVFLKDNDTEAMLIQKIKLLNDSRNHLFDLLEVISILPINDYERNKYAIFQTVNKIENRLKFDAFLSVPESIEKIDKMCASLTNAYNIKHKRIAQEVDKKVQNMYKTVAVVEQILDRSLPNIDTMSVTQWLAYEDIAAEKIKQSKDKDNGRK